MKWQDYLSDEEKKEMEDQKELEKRLEGING